MSKKKEKLSLQQAVTQNIEMYFDDMQHEVPEGLYELFLSQVEPPLIKVVLKRCHNNRSKAADMLGMNRNTLRKKMSLYRITLP